MNRVQAVSVLAPNGRRQTVKVNGNTTVLQILEEVCKKQGLKSEEYNIKHHNKSLDTSIIFRFSGLPNNAQLELAEATSIRQESIITIVVQLEDNTRLTESFSPNTSAWEILIKLCPDETIKDDVLIIYMRQEIYGKIKLQNTTLRSLGLTNGKALFRLMHRKEEKIYSQANVSFPLPKREIKDKNEFEKKEYTHKNDLKKKEDICVSQNVQQINATDETTLTNKSIKVETDVIKIIKNEKHKVPFVPQKEKSVNLQQIENTTDINTCETFGEEEFVFLDNRNAMIFSQKTAQAIPRSELPEEFFDLTINDAKKLLKDFKKRRLELENAPLLTTAFRDLEHSKQQLNLLNRYKSTVIRIYFPDQTVLQGTFSSSEDVGTVKEFVKLYLENNQMDFYLYTTPPKNILQINDKLVEIGCVPNAILHFAFINLNENEKYLKETLVNKFTTPSIASLAASKIRKENTRITTSLMSCDEMDLSNSDYINAGASTSAKDDSVYEENTIKIAKSDKNEPVPKWFKLSK